MEAAGLAIQASSSYIDKLSSPPFCPSCSTAGSPTTSRALCYVTGLWSTHCARNQHRSLRHFLPPMAVTEGSDGAFTDGAFTPSNEVISSLASACIAPTSAIDFLMLCHRLKATKRTGWVNHGLKDTESIADHMHRMAVMAIIAAGVPGINRDKCVKMAVVHDIAEAIVGDITPRDGIPKEEKSRRERAAIDEMCKMLGGGLAAEEVKELWLEYENNASLEANLVKDFDKVEMILQALEYETTHGKVLNEFYESTKGKFQTEIGKAWAAEVITRREKAVDLRGLQ